MGERIHIHTHTFAHPTFTHLLVLHNSLVWCLPQHTNFTNTDSVGKIQIYNSTKRVLDCIARECRAGEEAFLREQNKLLAAGSMRMHSLNLQTERAAEVFHFGLFTYSKHLQGPLPGCPFSRRVRSRDQKEKQGGQRKGQQKVFCFKVGLSYFPL